MDSNFNSAKIQTRWRPGGHNVLWAESIHMRSNDDGAERQGRPALATFDEMTMLSNTIPWRAASLARGAG